ncbi:MAG TPA: hypothetical protein VM425_10580 [Myxococcota bacterium]|nr:hypothetical protein [Myxococcota bacterium]
MADDKEIERLIEEITGRVLARLGSPASLPPAGHAPRILVVLPVASANLGILADQLAPLVAGGARVRVLCESALLGDIDSGGLRGKLGGDISAFSEADLSYALGEIGRDDLVLVGSIGFEHARALIDRRDGQPFVRLVSQALLAGRRVALVTDDLRPSGLGARGQTGAEAASILRDLDTLGLQPVAAADIAGLIEHIGTSGTTRARSFDGLVTEDDVEQLARAGERQLTLPAGTIVTPMAESRARDLGIEIVKLDV